MSKLKKAGIGFVIFFVVMMAIGYALNGESSTPAPTPTSTESVGVAASPTSIATPILRPQHVLPLKIPGFIFVERSDNLDPIFDGEDYSAYSCFVPLSAAVADKVENVCVFAYLFEDEASRDAAYAVMMGTRTYTNISINGSTAALQYSEREGEVSVTLLTRYLVIVSDSVPPFELPLPDPSTYDREALEAAAIAAMKAVIQGLP